MFLHYSNCSWNPEWGGETLFYKDNGKDVLDCNPYVPNRGVIFDGSILHTIKAQNTLDQVTDLQHHCFLIKSNLNYVLFKC